MSLIKYALNSWLVDGHRVTDIDDIYKHAHRSRSLFPDTIIKTLYEPPTTREFWHQIGGIIFNTNFLTQFRLSFLTNFFEFLTRNFSFELSFEFFSISFEFLTRNFLDF